MNKQDFKDYFENYYNKDMDIFREIRPKSEDERPARSYQK
jgi:hypothetical protein